MKNEERVGRPATSTSDDNIQQIHSPDSESATSFSLSSGKAHT